MRVNQPMFAERRKRLCDWHRWFAWRPVMMQDGITIVWLEYVMRKFDDRRANLVAPDYKAIEHGSID